MATSKGFPVRILYIAQQGKCFYCGKFLSKFADCTVEDHRGWTKDHVYPKSKPLPHHMNGQNNKVLACMPCNSKKGSRRPRKPEIARLKFINSLCI